MRTYLTLSFKTKKAHIYVRNLLLHILNAEMKNYLIGDNSTDNQWRDNGCNGRDAIGDGHHCTSKIRTEIDMIDLIAAKRSGIQTHRYSKNDDSPNVIVSGYEAHKR